MMSITFGFSILAVAMGAVSAPFIAPQESGDGAPLVPFVLAHTVCGLLAMAVLGHQPREEGRRRKADLERERRELWERTAREVDEIVAKYHARFPRHSATTVGAVYARYSTQHQDSVADQVRKILEEAIRLEVYVPREHVFFDLAVRGFTKDREGLNEVQTILKQKKATTLLLFATNRLFRKVYSTLEFVERVHKGWGVRCVFIKSGVDTNDAKQWEMILHTQSMIDQFVVTMYADNIRASHEGLLEKRHVFGTLSFGYRGEPIEGLTTSRGRPSCLIVLDDVTAKVVRQVFHWYVDQKLSIEEIIRRLNEDEGIPLPPRCNSGVWTRLAVRGLLENSRYRGVWKYGVTESVYVPDGDYVRQNVRLEPLKEVILEELRIVDDEYWFAAQERLAKEVTKNRGRRPVDGDSKSRPRLLHKLFVCPDHGCILYIGGPYGNSLHCRRCKGTKTEERPLFTLLNRKLALRLTCQKLAELVRADDSLVQGVITACQQHVELEQKPDPDRIQHIESKAQQLQRRIEFNQWNPGDTERDQAETASVIRQLRAERNKALHEIAAMKKAHGRKVVVPSAGEVQGMLDEFSKVLLAAADGATEEDAATAREIIDLLTGGQIELYQMGERVRNGGWLQGRFRVELVSVLVGELSGVLPAESGAGLEIEIDYREELLIDKQAEEALQLYEQDKLGKEIAEEMGVQPSYVSKLLDHAFAKRGLKRSDGRRRRSGLPNKQVKTPAFKRIADEAVALMEKGWSDLAIAGHLKTSDATVSKAIEFWHSSRELPTPTSKDRRRKKLLRAKELYEGGVLIKEIAPVVGYSPRGLMLALKEFYKELGETMPDGRSRRGNAKAGQRASGHAAQRKEKPQDSA